MVGSITRTVGLAGSDMTVSASTPRRRISDQLVKTAGGLTLTQNVSAGTGTVNLNRPRWRDADRRDRQCHPFECDGQGARFRVHGKSTKSVTLDAVVLAAACSSRMARP